MHAFGLLLFLASAPLALVGLCDPNARRGSVAVAFGLLGLPAGLVISVL